MCRDIYVANLQSKGGKISYKCRFSDCRGIQKLIISEHKKGGVYQRALPYATIVVIFAVQIGQNHEKWRFQ